MRALQGLALALVLLMLVATSATVVLSARGALDTNRATIEVMHGIGATDLQVTHLFQRKVALDALIGALTGAAVAALTLLLLAGAGAALTNQLGGLPPLHARDVLLLLLLPLGVALLATLVARTAVLSTLRRAI
jgi:cell division transport system permease protein